MKSAYFPDSSIERSRASFIKESVSQEISPERTDKRHDSVFIEFPKSRGILWDRTPIDHPRFFNSCDAVPQIFMSPSTLRPLMDSLEKSSDSNSKTVDKMLEITHISELSSNDFDALKQCSLNLIEVY